MNKKNIEKKTHVEVLSQEKDSGIAYRCTDGEATRGDVCHLKGDTWIAAKGPEVLILPETEPEGLGQRTTHGLRIKPLAMRIAAGPRRTHRRKA